MNYALPTSLRLGDGEYPINADFRTALDIFEVLNDRELREEEKIRLVLGFFYPQLERIPPALFQQALEECFRFLAGGREERPGPALMDWQQDFPYIIAPVNRVVGREIRGEAFFHWWSFLAAYMEIGQCVFGRIVGIRAARAAGKKLDKADAEWYRQNRELVELRQKFTPEEDDLMNIWGGKT